jgi:hypothetical protein
MTKYKSPKKELSYSEMTDTVYWVDGKGQKTNVSKGFMFVLGLMAKKLKGFKFNMTNNEDPDDSFSVEVRVVEHEETPDLIDNWEDDGGKTT